MTDKKRQDPRIRDTAARNGAASVTRQLDRVVAFAKAALLWERLWRALLVPVLVLGLFLCLSFAGLWLEVGRNGRIGGVALFGVAFLLALVPLLRLGRPSRKEALARIDKQSGVAHRPASGLDDSLANAGDDPATQALWALHQRRISLKIATLRVGAPSPRIADFDRYALRAAVLFALVACAFLAGPEKYARIAAAFDWHGGDAQAGGGFRLDAWIDPPPYTGKAPLLLNLAAAGSKSHDLPVKIEAPINSIVIIRAAGDTLGVETQGALEALKDDKPKDEQANKAKATVAPQRAEAAAGASEQRLALHGDAKLTLRRSGTLIGQFELSAIPDKPPRIQLTDAPHANARGSLTLAYKITDDYGVTGAEATFSNPTVETEALPQRSLVAPPHLTLNLGPAAGGLGATETTGDLSDHPWAGARVAMVLTARDEGGNEGKSDPIEIVLPQKIFTKPVARALVEQRRNLVLFPDDRGHVQIALDALMLAPESFETSAAIYLGLDIAANMLRKAHSDAEILAVADHLWAMALDIENGDLSDAERDLRASEQKLRDALQRNAPDEEIAKLTEELRAAMDKFLKEFAEKQMREQGSEHADRSGDRGRTISEKDLQAMLKRMQDMARSGDRADAQKMLEQLQNLLENLRTAQRRQADPQRQQMSKALSELDKMMRDQQDLRDQTHQGGEQADGDQNPAPRRHSPGTPQRQRPGKGEDAQRPNSQGQASEQDLQKRQQALRDRLQQLQKRMQQGGHEQPGLDEAEQAMGDAEKALGEGGEGRQNAEDAQGRALEAMRRGAQSLAQQMQQGDGQPGTEVGENEGESGASTQEQGSEDTDPLGRPLSADPLNPRARFDPLGVPAAQRAQRVLEELRKRLSDPSRSREEIDYLERLLKRY